MKGSCQKFETLQDGSVKLSIYFPREFKRQVIELSDEEVEVILAKDFQMLKDGLNWAMPEHSRQAMITAINVMKDMLEEKP